MERDRNTKEQELKMPRTNKRHAQIIAVPEYNTSVSLKISGSAISAKRAVSEDGEVDTKIPEESLEKGGSSGHNSERQKTKRKSGSCQGKEAQIHKKCHK